MLHTELYSMQSFPRYSDASWCVPRKCVTCNLYTHSETTRTPIHRLPIIIAVELICHHECSSYCWLCRTTILMIPVSVSCQIVVARQWDLPQLQVYVSFHVVYDRMPATPIVSLRGGKSSMWCYGCPADSSLLRQSLLSAGTSADDDTTGS